METAQVETQPNLREQVRKVQDVVKAFINRIGEKAYTTLIEKLGLRLDPTLLGLMEAGQYDKALSYIQGGQSTFPVKIPHNRMSESLRTNKYISCIEYLAALGQFTEAQQFIDRIAKDDERIRLVKDTWITWARAALRNYSVPTKELQAQVKKNTPILLEAALTLSRPTDRDVALNIIFNNVFDAELVEQVVDNLSTAGARDEKYHDLARRAGMMKGMKIIEKIEDDNIHDGALATLATDHYKSIAETTILGSKMRSDAARVELYTKAAKAVDFGDGQAEYMSRAYGYAGKIDAYSKDRDTAYAGIVSTLVDRFAQSECPSIYPTLKLMRDRDIRTASILRATTTLGASVTRYYASTKTVSAYRRAEKRQKYDTFALDVKAQLSKISNDADLSTEATKKVLDGVIAKIKFFKR